MNFARSNIAVLFSGIVVSWALAGCASDATEPTEDEDVSTTAQAQKKAPPGGGGGGNTCVDRWQNCYAGCGGQYPGGDARSEAQRSSCELACDMGFTVCKSGAYGGGGGGVYAP